MNHHSKKLVGNVGKMEANYKCLQHKGFVTRTSSIKITDGCLSIATMKSVRTSFSASPTCFANEK